MALDTQIYLVSKEIAVRSGLINNRYRISDGRYVFDNKDLSRIRLTSDEYVNGLQGVEKIDEATAQTLIARNGYVMGDVHAPSREEIDEQETENEENTEE